MSLKIIKTLLLLLTCLLYSLDSNAAGETKDQTYAIWSVYLSSYYGNPPPARELAFLDNADVPYEIEKNSVNGADWYRVLVINAADYKTAKAYAEMLKVKLGVKDIWISKKKEN